MAGRGKLTGAGRAAADLPLGSWRRTLIAAAVIVLAFVAVLGVATASGPLRHTSFPGHPYPPTGFSLNPFSNSPDDLVDAAEAARVKADLLNDGAVELQALQSGDPSMLTRSTTGNELAQLRKVVEANNANGVTERDQPHLDSVIVGRLQDPNASTTWCVEERGSGGITYLAKSDGRVVRTDTVSFDNRFWLARVGGRYLITDVEVRSPQGQQT